MTYVRALGYTTNRFAGYSSPPPGRSIPLNQFPELAKVSSFQDALMFHEVHFRPLSGYQKAMATQIFTASYGGKTGREIYAAILKQSPQPGKSARFHQLLEEMNLQHPELIAALRDMRAVDLLTFRTPYTQEYILGQPKYFTDWSQNFAVLPSSVGRESYNNLLN